MNIHFIQHVPFETPGHLLQWAHAHQHTTSFTRIYEEISFPDVNTIDLLVIMGGPMGVYEEDQYHWLKTEKTFIRNTIDAGKKVLGICLGSQLIAEACGARVYPNKLKEIGWWPLQKIDSHQANPYTGSFPDTFTVFHWHGDTFDLPANAIHLFSTPACTNQGYVINNQVAGFQFHMEATPALVQEMAIHSANELVEAPYIQTAQVMEAHSPAFAPVQHQYLEQFLDTFLKVV